MNVPGYNNKATVTNFKKSLANHKNFGSHF